MTLETVGLSIWAVMAIATPAYPHSSNALQGCPENREEVNELFSDRNMSKNIDGATYQFPANNLTMFGKRVLGLYSDQADSGQLLGRTHFLLEGGPSTYSAALRSKYENRAKARIGLCDEDVCTVSFPKAERQLNDILMRHQDERDSMPAGTYLNCYYER